MMKKNSGLMVQYTFLYPNGDINTYITDGYVNRDVAESICSARTIATMNFSNRMGTIKDPKDYVLSESSTFATNEGFILDIGSTEIDVYERRRFNTQAAVCRELQKFCEQM